GPPSLLHPEELPLGACDSAWTSGADVRPARGARPRSAEPPRNDRTMSMPLSPATRKALLAVALLVAPALAGPDGSPQLSAGGAGGGARAGAGGQGRRGRRGAERVRGSARQRGVLQQPGRLLRRARADRQGRVGSPRGGQDDERRAGDAGSGLSAHRAPLAEG